MTRKDYLMVSGAMRAAKIPYVQAKEVCEALAAEFAKENPRFDKKQFFEACGL